ncbi:hypothetical protein CMI42_03045 [Candidatus Pacearchaeota archaeon]|nr:hypothetical protein [Candidatus Pacearchaeota archaeon]|tara:strand:- start:327 stop:551 length:225 start_codon:yes stop_codon:yes gene_type:complete
MKLPLISSDKMLKYLSGKGFVVMRQKGSHITLHKKENNKIILVVVPRKPQIKRGTLLSILRQSKISREQFVKEI